MLGRRNSHPPGEWSAGPLGIASPEAETARVIDLRHDALIGEIDRIGRLEPHPSAQEDRLRDGISIMAHEVRGPLLATRVAIERALQELDRPGGVGGLLERAWREIDGIARHVDRLLAWGAGLRDLATEPADLCRVIDQAVESCVLELGQDRVRISRRAFPVVDADADHLRAALANLVRNAMQYSPVLTDINVSIEVIDQAAVVTVEDRGPGVPADEQRSIFDPFVRGSAGGRGRGIGLFFTRSVVEALGGSIWCESKGTGASFLMWLPLSTGEVASSAS